MSVKFAEISEQDFFILSKMLTEKYGIKLPMEKRIMFQARLQARLRWLGYASFSDYRDFVLNPKHTRQELGEMIDLVSTNKTEFFRENEHFELLKKDILPQLMSMINLEEPFLNCWSAGCSKGHEAFTLAMILDDFEKKYLPGLDFHILGTDVSRQIIQYAQKGIYPFSESEPIPVEFRKSYLLRSKDQTIPKIKIVNALRSRVDFCYGNLMDDEYELKSRFQIIFLRNTLIYFETETQTAILRKVIKQLQPGGFLFIGHSESLINRGLTIESVAPSVYQKTIL
ncbi:protein-glutamate O-methyltransferase CheR [uncultured Sunxiuqinia sp.]|uniref:CheR family methyltransferase n=1 Tax=uncultured Sunxiuqinia sp. TaxID=1573825 RepID=UPI002AA7D696|nr:protein-glutamate O-methyltransferase CheR [uncultured Sunxiuqinia sp.]